MITSTAILFLIAIVSMQLSRAPQSAVGVFVWSGMLTFGGVLAMRVAYRRIVVACPIHLPRIVATAIWTLTGIGVTAIVTSGSFASEEVLMAGLLGIAAALLIRGGDERALQQVALLSLVVVIFTLPALHERYQLVLMEAAAASGTMWLSASRGPLGRWGWAYSIIVTALVVAACVVAHRHFQPLNRNPSYAGWVPSSGGDGAGSDQARRGVGDGPDEIIGASASSVGFDQGETFSESGKDGLYDLWIESYGKPVTPGEHQKMVGLKPHDIRLVQAPDRENLRVGRSFEMRRQKDGTALMAAPPDAGANAKLWVKGPLPAYIPLAVFEEYDAAAATWREMEPGKPSVPARKRQDSNWMDILHRPISPAFDGSMEYQVRVGDLGGAVLPLLPSTERFRMGRIARADFFAATRSGLVRLAQRNLPAGATLDVVCKRVAPSELVNVEPALRKHCDPALFGTDTIDPRVQCLAEDFGAGQPRGWTQIEQIISRLRDRVTFDPSPNASVDPVSEVLFDARRGTDYQIATAAVMLLRSLEYPTRLASGFYADESRLDRSSGFVALGPKQVHFWTEVRLADGTWVSVDATPGYPMLNLPRSFGDWLATVWKDTKWMIGQHAIRIGAVIVLVVSVSMTWRRLLDRFATLACTMAGRTPISVFRLLELRARLARMPRLLSHPPASWIMSMNRAEYTMQFIAALNRALYAPAISAASSAECQASRQLLQNLTYARMRKRRKETTK